MLTANYHCFFHPKTTAAWNFMPRVIKFNIYYNTPLSEVFKNSFPQIKSCFTMIKIKTTLNKGYVGEIVPFCTS